MPSIGRRAEIVMLKVNAELKDKGFRDNVISQSAALSAVEVALQANVPDSFIVNALVKFAFDEEYTMTYE